MTCLAAVVEMSVSFLRTSFEGDEFDSSGIEENYRNILIKGSPFIPVKSSSSP